MPMLRAIYDHAGDGTTPAFKKGDILTLIQQHDSGWIEVITPNGEAPINIATSPAGVYSSPCQT